MWMLSLHKFFDLLISDLSNVLMDHSTISYPYVNIILVVEGLTISHYMSQYRPRANTEPTVDYVVPLAHSNICYIILPKLNL